jgi:hypothetical protein
MNALIAQLIRSCHGYVHETAGIITGFFDNPQQAKACAARIEAQFHAHVQLCGCELTIIR